MLPFGGEPEAIDAAVDRIRRRYGNSALTRAVLVGRPRTRRCPVYRTEAQSRSLSTGQVLMMRSAATPASSAR
ncbi:hypothetical protein I551_8485 [Mycobacterium ulcerans str. Harvey]|uniref:ImpB/mucB/samB family protein n=1 Tax=Mycobacterium ulcerans str. Harvey TaxID=1299332 RepID=A0ABN0RAN1_MYCUL|nr:hypothetical protein I551_8485 [Mycobacterium ulcerans str. Harvey]